MPHSSYADYCGFRYGPAATPTVTDVSPAIAPSNGVVTLSGSGFSEVSSENTVFFGPVECVVVSSSQTSIECTLGRGYGGLKPLYLHVLYSGVAETNTLGITFPLSLSGISPSEGSQVGGTEVIITGAGFYHSQDTDSNSVPFPASEAVADYLSDTECPGGWSNQVSIGGAPCTIVNSTATSLTVITPKQPTPPLPSYDLEVTIVCLDNLTVSAIAVLQDIFSYNSSLTSTVLDITPASGTILGGETVVISGMGFSLSSKVLVSQPLVMMHRMLCQPSLKFYSLVMPNVW